MKLVNYKNRKSIIVKIDKDNIYFSNPDDNDSMCFYPWVKLNGAFYYATEDVVSDKDMFFYKHSSGSYCLRSEFEMKKNQESPKTKNSYPYSIDREYGASISLDRFQKVFDEMVFDIPKINHKPIKYTFGIEYETSCGVVPQNECYKKGIIPLRDGSITGNEYASVVLNESKILAIKKQVELLNKYTDSDKDCAVHIHFGGSPLELNYVFILNCILKFIEGDVKNLCYEHVFNTELYKSSGKSYCMKLKNYANSFDFYSRMAMGSSYFGSLYEEHPADPSGNHKWQIKTRYLWCNFINAMFYDKCKTIEFRHFRPTKNPNMIIANIHIYSAILEYAECVYERLKNECDNLSYKKVFEELERDSINGVEDIVKSVDREYLVDFINMFKLIKEKRDSACDYICNNHSFDSLIKSIY